jgi:hypothetical protein
MRKTAGRFGWIQLEATGYPAMAKTRFRGSGGRPRANRRKAPQRAFRSDSSDRQEFAPT